MTEHHRMTWAEAQARMYALAETIRTHHSGRVSVYGIPRGGAIVAGLLSGHGFHVVETPEDADVLVEDIVDSGATKERWTAIHDKPVCPLVKQEDIDGWVIFPWEERDPTQDIADTVRRQLELVGEDPKREGLIDTPTRVIKALREMTEGYSQDPKEILARVFTADPNDEMVVVRNIEFASLCEHHMLPFTGTATVGYIPREGRVVGLSKIPRLVNCYARRLQMQERLTYQVAHAMDKNLSPIGVGVVLQAFHTCCALRGVRATTQMVTSCLLGRFRTGPQVRSEFLALAAAR